jgi:intracellular septation protein A
MPGYAVLQSWYQGALVKARRTRPITEAVLLYFALSSGLLAIGIARQETVGIYWALGSFVVAGCAQTTWLWWRSRKVLRELNLLSQGTSA